ncbi:threonine dehydrogenase-like Zn-dependent dehydrogenase [Bradyrhizobium sp. F1.13.1]
MQDRISVTLGNRSKTAKVDFKRPYLVQNIDLPNPADKTINQGVILKVVTTNICDSDQDVVRGR